MKLLSGKHRIAVVIVGSSPVCRLEKGTVVCVALWVVCFKCDRCVTGMSSGQVTGETPLGNCKRLDHSLSHAVFFLSLLLPSFTQPCGKALPLPPPLPHVFFFLSLSGELSNYVLTIFLYSFKTFICSFCITTHPSKRPNVFYVCAYL